MARILDIASYIYDEYKTLSGECIDEMKLHKLLYLSQREKIAIMGQPMFSESFQGWKYGPVNPDVRYAYTKYGINNDFRKDISDTDAYIAKNIVLQYGGYEPWKLSDMTHNEISWRHAREGLPAGANGDRELLLSDIRKDAEKVRPYDSLYDMYYDEFEDAEDPQE